MGIESPILKLPPKDRSENVSTGTTNSGIQLKMESPMRKTSEDTNE
jgi:hypothetical protein